LPQLIPAPTASDPPCQSTECSRTGRDAVITHAIELTIDRPVEEVFAFITDAACHPRWDSS